MYLASLSSFPLEDTKMRKESRTKIQEKKLWTMHPLKIKKILLFPSFVKLLEMWT
jgi:hypothetical protein